MNAHELAKILLDGPDVQVIMQDDAAGNGYRPLEGADPDVVYVPESNRYGEVYGIGASADDNCMVPEAWEAIKNNPDRACVVLFPR